MNQVILKVSGQVTESNFPEYRDEILAKIAGIKTDLVTDDDFAEAKKTVKICKDAETHLDVALQQAISEAAEIDELFNSVKTVIGTLRNTRLDLSKKVKTEEQKRRAEIIQGGKQTVKDFMSDQVPVIRNMDVDYLFIDSAAKGKRGIAGVSTAVDEAVLKLLDGIKETCKHVGNNDLVFQTIASMHKSLFPDHHKLLFMPEQEMVEIIEGRIAKAELEEKQRQEAIDAAKAELEAIPGPTTTKPPEIKEIEKPIYETMSPDGSYQVVIRLLGTPERVNEIYFQLEQAIGHNKEVVSARLTKN